MIGSFLKNVAFLTPNSLISLIFYAAMNSISKFLAICGKFFLNVTRIQSRAEGIIND